MRERPNHRVTIRTFLLTSGWLLLGIRSWLLHLLQVQQLDRNEFDGLSSPAVSRSEKGTCVNAGISIDKPSSPLFLGIQWGRPPFASPRYFFAYTAEI